MGMKLQQILDSSLAFRKNEILNQVYDDKNLDYIVSYSTSSDAAYFKDVQFKNMEYEENVFFS